MNPQVRYLSEVARYSADIRTGALAFDYRTGQCGPVQASQLKSWGAGCPSGYCPPSDLPEALGRWFAGDRAGCREIPYAIRFTTSAGLANSNVSTSRAAPITMCPTRVMAWADGGEWLIRGMSFGAQEQIIGGPTPVGMFDPMAYQPVPFVPDCVRSGIPMTFDVTLRATGGDPPPVLNMWIVLIGPMVG